MLADHFRPLPERIHERGRERERKRDTEQERKREREGWDGSGYVGNPCITGQRRKWRKASVLKGIQQVSLDLRRCGAWWWSVFSKMMTNKSQR